MRYISSNSTDPRWNLALEQYVFDELDRREQYLLLWQNDHTIVVGKNQNTVQEINNDYVRTHGITVVRRLSGGGAVYHDLGNLNYTFVADAGNMEELNLRMFCQPIVETLRSFGVTAEISGRNDITVDGRKFSGNSQYIRQGRVMHHGTLLFSSDLSVVARALHVDREKIESKGISSVRSRVTNLCEYLGPQVTLDTFRARLLDCLRAGHDVTPLVLTESDREKIHQIQEQRYDTWAWNYGRSPAYTTRFSRRIEGCGQVEVALSVERGCIRGIEFFGDFFGSGDLTELSALLLDCPYRVEEVEKRLSTGRLNWYIQKITPKELAEVIVP